MTTRRATFRWWVAGLWLALLVSSTPGLEVRGGEPAASDGGGLGGRELRIFDVSSLTVGFPDFECGDGPGAEVVARAPARPDGAKPAPVPPLDRPDPRPAFGGEREEWIRPFGTLDDVVEFLKRVHREALTVEGVRLYPIGGDRLVLVGPRALADAVASSLDDLERAYARFATIDVLALRGDVGRFADGDLGAALACGGLVPLAGARGVGSGRSFASFVGGYEAYVAREDAEVDVRAKAFDPVVGVARDGLAFEARIGTLGGDRVQVDLHAWWARPGASVRHDVGVTRDPVETRETETRAFDGVVALTPDVWRVLPSTGDVVFAARVSVTPRTARRPLGEPLATTGPIADSGPVALRDHAVRDLGMPVGSYRGSEWWLAPSSYIPAEPPPLRDSRAAFPGEALVDTLRTAVDPASWSAEGRAIDLKNGVLYVRTDDAHDRAVAAFLGRLRDASLRSTRLRATDVALPLAAVPEYVAGLGDGATLLRDGVRGLLARPGARVVGRAAITLRDGQRANSDAGTWHTYVGDFDPEICEASQIGNPIVRNGFEGVVLDAQAVPSVDGSAVLCEVRWTRCTWRGSRKVPTSMGEIECPSLGISRIRGAVSIPRGAGRVIGVALEGGEVTLTILEVSP